MTCKTNNWQIADRKTREQVWKNSNGVSTRDNALLLCDPVLKILKPKLMGSLQGPVTAPIETANQLEAIRRVMKLLQEAGFIAGEFDAQILLECDHD